MPQYTGSEFSCKDIRGIWVDCPIEQWKYLTKHKEMVGLQGVVKAVIEKPDFINQSKSDINRELYYKQLVIPVIGNTYIRVVVEKEDSKTKTGMRTRRVINAFSCDGSSKGEKQIWKR